MKFITDITGRCFGRLEVVELVGKEKSGAYLWKCKCKCGNDTLGSYKNMKSGRKLSCGCLAKEISKKNGSIFVKHLEGMDRTSNSIWHNSVINADLSKNNKTGKKGVSWSKEKQKFLAYINNNKNRIFLGYFEKLEDAVAARKNAEIKIYGLEVGQ